MPLPQTAWGQVSEAPWFASQVPRGHLASPDGVSASHSRGMWWWWWWGSSKDGRESGWSHVDPAWVCPVLQRPPQSN